MECVLHDVPTFLLIDRVVCDTQLPDSVKISRAHQLGFLFAGILLRLDGAGLTLDFTAPVKFAVALM